MKHLKKTVCSMFLALVIVVLLSGCGGGVKTETPAITETPTISETPPAEPVTIAMSFPDGAPPLNQAAVFRCTVANTLDVAKNITIEATYPGRSYKLVSGSLSWSGTVPANGEMTVIEAMLKSDNTGHYEIKANCTIDPEPDGYGGEILKIIYVASGMASSEWGNTPPWQK